ncbi:hypothetical protein EYF80_049384 [Liparis tanakae]|uniref:Uncharacterized protein n=1 Tax=Liparis tanakae TaxID=230148 RepID=A0A4Z2FJI3_9TELE|nr:hypothetical protein EYF80_049384 [Liparis tanakae]
MLRSSFRVAPTPRHLPIPRPSPCSGGTVGGRKPDSPSLGGHFGLQPSGPETLPQSRDGAAGPPPALTGCPELWTVGDRKQAGGGKQKRSHCEGEATGLFLL